jgi:hypothetical protein
MLSAIPNAPSRVECSISTTASEGATITASGSTHTKGSYTELIASSSRDAYGITVLIWGAQTAASTNNRGLLDIAIGAASSEVDIVPNLLYGGTSVWSGTTASPAIYYFPIHIRSGTRISARCQNVTASRTCTCIVWLHHTPVGPDGWVGSRVQAYGASTSTSTGVSHSPGNGSYATATEITASCARPIRAMQLGLDMGTDTTGSTARGLARIGIGSTPHYVAEHLPTRENTTLETNACDLANLILATMRFSIPTGTRLVISAMRNVAAEARGWVIYGVD